MRRFLAILSLIGLLNVLGCSGIEPPMPDKILTHPLGTTPLKIGMTKANVRNIWGEPDLIRHVGESSGPGSTTKEEWIYYGRMSTLPINCGYLARPQHLYFDGDSLTNFKEG